MKNLKICVLLLLILGSFNVSAQKYKTLKGQHIAKNYNGLSFQSDKSLSENLTKSAEFSIFQKALENENLKRIISGYEMVTVFVFTDDSFNQLPKKQKDSLLGSNAAMSNLLTYLMVSGRVDLNSLKTEAAKKNGKASLITIQGQEFEVTVFNGKIYLIDKNGNKAELVSDTLFYEKGIFHIINNVIFPKNN